MPYPGLLHPEPLPLRQATADPYPTRDAQTQFCLSLCGVYGSWCVQGLFKPSECLWVWGLILNVILPLVRSFWGFSFALRHGVSPHSRSSTMHCHSSTVQLLGHGIWSHHFMANRWGNSGNSGRLYFQGVQNHCR